MIKEKNKLEEINMLNDAMFKAIFRSMEARDMVASFLSSITGIEKEILKNADYQGGELPKKKIKEKGKTSDIIVKIEDNHRIILEMNQYRGDKIFEKNMSYAFSIASETVLAGTKKYPAVILIHIDNFNAFETKEGILNFKIRDEYGHIETDQYHSIHLVLENIVNNEYNIDKEVRKIAIFLKKKNLKEMEEEFKGDEKYMAAIRKVEDLSTDPNFVGYYDIEEARKQDLEDMKATGFRIGHEEGKKQGIEQGQKNKQMEIAKNLLKFGMKIEDISKATGLSIDEIKKLD